MAKHSLIVDLATPPLAMWTKPNDYTEDWIKYLKSGSKNTTPYITKGNLKSVETKKNTAGKIVSLTFNFESKGFAYPVVVSSPKR